MTSESQIVVHSDRAYRISRSKPSRFEVLDQRSGDRREREIDQ
jgi:hypothetical protein